MRVVLGIALATTLAGCANQVADISPSTAVGGASALVLAGKASYLRPEYLAVVGIAYALYDPWAPNWDMEVTALDDSRIRFDMRLRAFHSGGEGEARQVLHRNARRLAQERGFSGFEIMQFEEGVESTRPIARRVASAEVRLYKSRLFPNL